MNGCRTLGARGACDLRICGGDLQKQKIDLIEIDTVRPYGSEVSILIRSPSGTEQLS